MNSLADRTIACLRDIHDDLMGLVPDLTDDQLSAPSGASEWTVAQVLSHLGSGAEIARAGYRAGLDGQPAPGQDFNQSVWDRWNALSPRDQAAGYVEADAALVEMLEALTPDERANLHIKLDFLPEPMPLASIAGMRLNEAAQHAWDVHAGLDPAATIDASCAQVLIDHFTGGLAFLLGYIGKADSLPEPATVEIDNTDVVITIDDQVSLSTSPTAATATFHGGLEAVIRLITGRLTTSYTPAGVDVTGNVSLDDLRRVFPGY